MPTLKLSREANQGARRIVRLVEALADVKLSMTCCSEIIFNVQMSINEAATESPEAVLLGELRRNAKLLKKYQGKPGLSALQGDLLRGTQALLTAKGMERATETLRGNQWSNIPRVEGA